MVWSIYSTGDGSFLASVLDACAMIFNSGITEAAFALALTAGVLYQGLKSTAMARGIDYAQILAVFLIYCLFFVPKVTVSVTDLMTQSVRTVDNVPLGPAAIGSIISRTSYAFTKKFSAAFGTAARSGNEFLDPLVVLSKLRTSTAAVSRLSEVSSVGGSDFTSSWRNYFRECTDIGVDLGTISVRELLESPDPVQSAGFASSLYGTAINIAGQEELLDCTEAHQKLLAYTRGPYMTKFLESLDAKEASASGAYGRLDSTTLREALTTLGLADTAVRDYVLASVLLPVYREAAEGKHLGEGAFAQAIMVREATLNRNTRLVAEENLFLKSVRPLLGFLEALVYAISPFMPLVLGLGWGGFSMLGRYFGVMLWCGIQGPLMLVVNFYAISAASGELAALSIPSQSLSGLGSMLEITEDYLALSGLLMTSVPVLAGLLVYGSTQALSHVLSGATGGNAINTSTALPELSGSAPVTSGSAMFEKSLAGGVIRDGGRSYVADFSMSRGYEEAQSAAQSRAVGARSAFSQALSETQQSMLGETITTSSLERMGNSVASSRAESAGVINSLSHSISESMGLDSRQENALRGAVGAVLGGGSSDTGLLSSLTLGASGGSQSGESVSRLASALEGISQDKSLRASFTSSVSRDVSSGVTTGFTESKSKGLNSALTHSAEETVAAENTLSALKSSRSSLGAQYNMDGASLARTTASNIGLFERLGQHISGSDTLSTRTQELATMLGEYYPDKRQAYAAAAYTAMLEEEPLNAYEFMCAAAGCREFKSAAAIDTSVGATPDTQILSGGLSAPAGVSKVTPEEAWTSWQGEVANAANRAAPKHAASAFLGEAISRPVGNYSVRSPLGINEAHSEAKALGLGGSSGELYASFAAGETPTNELILRTEKELGGGDTARNAIKRIRAAAISGDEALVKPVVAWKETLK